MSAVNDQILAELNEIASGNGNKLTPELVLARAQDPASALHSRFTWDDAQAATLRRIDEARALIMQVRVKIQPRPDQPAISVRAFVSLDSDRVDGGGYRPIVNVLEDGEMRAQLLRTAIAELQALQRRYGNLQELAQVFASIPAQEMRAAG